jgi:hypothetical protein
MCKCSKSRCFAAHQGHHQRARVTTRITGAGAARPAQVCGGVGVVASESIFHDAVLYR